MKLDWISDDLLPSHIKDMMNAAAAQCLLTEGVTLPCAATVMLCDDEYIAAVNESTRGIRQSTDVLSFPTVQYPAGKTAGSCPDLLRQEYDDELQACFLGDIIISVPHMYAQAEEYGHSRQREGAYLLVHGICHLMGYDHMVEEDKAKMRAMEEKILESISMSRETSWSELDLKLVNMAKEAMKFSYSPYSHFAVGAAVHCMDGRIFTGCNVENVSYGMSNCAERTAIFKAVSEGAREFDLIAIAAAGQMPWPCGACRQVMAEFSPGLRILLTHEDQIIEKSLSDLLPHCIELETKE